MLLDNPIDQFKVWFEEAKTSQELCPQGMVLATVDEQGHPAARVVLYKGLYEDGFLFYTNYNSPKGHELVVQPRASLVFYWASMGKQLRIDGDVEKAPRSISEAYFKSRARLSQLGAWASEQSEVVESREALEARFKTFESKFSGKEVPCPPHWGGYRLMPISFEFWIEQPGRFHDRIKYVRTKETWKKTRLSP